ncbi:MAG: thioredoxin family protein [Pikeienuella sp.]
MRFAKPLIFAAIAMLFAALAPAVSAAGQLVMVEQAGCHWCERWHEEVGVIYHKTDEAKAAPLRQVDIFDLPDDLNFKTRPQFTPTFVLFEGSEEVGRIEGYPSEDFFWPLLNQMIAKLPNKTGDEGSSLGN